MAKIDPFCESGKVRIKTLDGKEYTGVVDVYCSAYDNDNGLAGICFTSYDNTLDAYICEDELLEFELLEIRH